MRLSAARPALLLLAAAFAAVIAIAAPPAAADEQSDLDDARVLWTNSISGIDEYSYQYQRSCFCYPPDVLRPMTLAVKSGRVVSAKFADGEEENVPKKLQNGLPTVEGLFDIVQSAITNSADKMDIDYNLTYGHPTTISIDHDERVADEETSISASEMKLGPVTVVTSGTETVEIDWIYDLPEGGTTITLMQCQSLRFSWNTAATSSVPHDLVQFPNRKSYRQCYMDGERGKVDVLVPSSTTGSFTLGPDDTARPGRRYYGCSVGNHCAGGKMKLTVDVVPDFTVTHADRACRRTGKRKVKRVKTSSLGQCKRRCEKRTGCMGYEYRPSDVFGEARSCKLYVGKAPTRGGDLQGATCVATVASCS